MNVKILLRLTVWIFGMLLAIIIGSLTYSLICDYPQIAYDRLDASHPLTERCKILQPGMDLAATTRILASPIEPAEQRFEDQRLMVRQGETACVVDFDPITKRVTKAETQTTAGPRWNKGGF